MRHTGQQRSEILSWTVATLQVHLVILHTALADEAREKNEVYKALGPIGALLGGV